jgi:hypothetical protein
MQNREAPGRKRPDHPQELIRTVSNPLLRNSLKRCHDAGNGDCDFFHNLSPNLMPPNLNCQPSFFRSTVFLMAPSRKHYDPFQTWDTFERPSPSMGYATPTSPRFLRRGGQPPTTDCQNCGVFKRSNRTGCTSVLPQTFPTSLPRPHGWLLDSWDESRMCGRNSCFAETRNRHRLGTAKGRDFHRRKKERRITSDGKVQKNVFPGFFGALS